MTFDYQKTFRLTLDHLLLIPYSTTEDSGTKNLTRIYLGKEKFENWENGHQYTTNRARGHMVDHFSSFNILDRLK